MSPEKFLKINGARPSPLKINKESHTILKPSDHNHHQQHHHHHQQQLVTKQRHQPVIIYTHSPKIIHAEPRDFMAVVQSLTGMSTRNDDKSSIQEMASLKGPSQALTSYSTSTSEAKSDKNESSSVLTDEMINCGGNNNNGSDRNYLSLSDIPLFTPNASTDFNFFCSPRPAFRFPDATPSSSLSPNLGSTSFSPSFLEFIKGLPEY